MNKEPLDQLISEATIGLKGDPEIRLDVQQELASHLDAAAAEHRAEGKSESESLVLAAKAFGSPVDMAAELQSANRSRMKWRALARLAVAALLVPAAVAAAWFMTPPMVTHGRLVISSLSALNGSFASGDDFLKIQESYFHRNLSHGQKLILFGDKTRKTPAEQQRAIWEKDPTNRVFYGNYITHLVSGGSWSTNEPDLALAEAAFREGERLDPDNARFNYLLAHLMLQKAAEVRYGYPIPNSTNLEYRLVIKDRALLDQAMAEFMKGQQKPFWATYTKEMFALRMSLLPASRTMVERIWKIGIAAGLLLPDLAQQRQLARASILYGELFVSEGRKQDAIPFLESWYGHSRKIFSDGFTLIDQLVAFAIVKMGNERGIPALAAAGETVRAENMKHRSQALLAPNDQWKERRKQIDSQAQETAEFTEYTGPLMGMLMPALGEPYPTKAETAYERLTWYVLMEQAASMVFMYLFLAMMFLMLPISLRWRWTKGFASAPLLILPGGKDFPRILGLSVLLPLSIYFLYTRYSGLSGQEYSMMRGIWIVPAEILTLAMTILFMAVLLSVRHSWRRCRELEIPVPNRLSGGWMLFLAVIPFALPVWLLWGKREGLFRGTVARSLIPIFACVVILVGLTTQPYLAFREQFLVRNDPLLSYVERGAGFSKPETDLVKRLQREVLAAFDSLDIK